MIGDGYGENPVTVNRISAALSSIGQGPVTVYVNSPGGDMFAGVAIYNMLREHQGPVTVKVLGLAASAASIIAMAGDRVQIAKSAFLMIHNAWTFAIGNRKDLMETAAALDKFDNSLSEIYADRTGLPVAQTTQMMDDETWLSGEQAVDMRFADEFLPVDQVRDENSVSAPSGALLQTVAACLRPSLSKTLSHVTETVA